MTDIADLARAVATLETNCVRRITKLEAQLAERARRHAEAEHRALHDRFDAVAALVRSEVAAAVGHVQAAEARLKGLIASPRAAIAALLLGFLLGGGLAGTLAAWGNAPAAAALRALW
jgi:hypothetical protein